MLTWSSALAACGHAPAARPGTPVTPAPDAGVSFVVDAGSPVRMTARATDPSWERARGGDALALARLADENGAAGLLEGVEDGGEVRATALLALPWADDADVALARLGEIAEADPTARRGVLEAMLGIAKRPRDQREPLDVEGARRAGEALLSIAALPGIDGEERATALSAARALSERGLSPESALPRERF